MDSRKNKIFKESENNKIRKLFVEAVFGENADIFEGFFKTEEDLQSFVEKVWDKEIRPSKNDFILLSTLNANENDSSVLEEDIFLNKFSNEENNSSMENCSIGAYLIDGRPEAQPRFYLKITNKEGDLTDGEDGVINFESDDEEEFKSFMNNGLTEDEMKKWGITPELCNAFISFIGDKNEKNSVRYIIAQILRGEMSLNHFLGKEEDSPVKNPEKEDKENSTEENAVESKEDNSFVSDSDEFFSEDDKKDFFEED